MKCHSYADRHLRSPGVILGRALTGQSSRRRARRILIQVTIVAASTLGLVALVPQPVVATAASHIHQPPPHPHSIRKITVIGHIIPRRTHPATCTPSIPTLPSPSTNTLAYLAESPSNEVQAVDEATGALIGTPITVGTSPQGVSYWRPPPGSAADPLVVVTNSGSHSVTVIDAITQSVVATISVPSGSTAIGVAASPTKPYAVVVDHYTGKVSIIDLSNDSDAGE